MRLPLIAELDSRDGSANKDSRLTNTLKESDEGVDMVVVRPGLKFATKNVRLTTTTGKGLVSFNDEIISVYGATLCDPVENWTADSRYLDADTGMSYMQYLGLNGSTIFVSSNYINFSLGEKFFSFSVDNGATWTASSPSSFINGEGYISNVTVMPNGGYLIRHVGNFTKEYWTSTDGETWTTRLRTGINNWFGSSSGCHNGSRLVIGDAGWIHYSDDNGVSFISLNIFANYYTDSTVFDGTRFVIATQHFSNQGMQVFTSTDGITWASVYLNSTISPESDIKFYAGKYYLLVKEISTPFARYLASSADLVNWDFDICDVSDPVDFLPDGGKFFVLGYDYGRAEGPSSISKKISYSNPIYLQDDAPGSFRDAVYVGGRYLVTTDFSDGKLIEVTPVDGVTVLGHTVVTGDFFDFAQSTL